MSSPAPTGLLPSEVAALRSAAGISTEDFATAFGVATNVVERWEAYGVATGPTALAIRLVAQTMDFEFPPPPVSDTNPCAICGAPAPDSVRAIAVCPACHRDPVHSMETVGYEATKSHNLVSNQTSYTLRLPAGRSMSYSGRFLSEGLGTMLTKLFKDEPQIGQQSWDDAVYVQWVEPGLDAISDPAARDLIQTLVTFGMVDVEPGSVSVQNAPSYGSFDNEILLLCGLLASRS